eukprot:tig00000158_g10204.t1
MIYGMPKLPPGSDQRAVRDHLRQFEQIANLSKDLLSAAPSASEESQLRTGWALLITLDDAHPVRQDVQVFQSAEQTISRELEELRADRAKRAENSTGAAREQLFLEALDERIARNEESLRKAKISVTYAAIRRRLEGDSELRNPDQYKAILDLPYLGETPEAFFRRLIGLCIVPECRAAHETPLMALMRHAGEMIKRRSRYQLRDFEDSEVTADERRHLITNYNSVRTIYDELSKMVAERSITESFEVTDYVRRRASELGAWDVDISRIPGAALILRTHGGPARAAPVTTRPPAAPASHTPAVPVVPSRTSSSGAGTRIMYAPVATEDDYAEASEWEAEDDGTQRAELIAFLQCIAQDEPSVVIRALYPSASAPPPRIDDPVYQQKIKDFLKARGLPEKPRRNCPECNEPHYTFECRIKPRPLPEWAAISPMKRIRLYAASWIATKSDAAAPT